MLQLFTNRKKIILQTRKQEQKNIKLLMYAFILSRFYYENIFKNIL